MRSRVVWIGGKYRLPFPFHSPSIRHLSTWIVSDLRVVKMLTYPARLLKFSTRTFLAPSTNNVGNVEGFANENVAHCSYSILARLTFVLTDRGSFNGT